jgi:hypothetical protein
LEVVTEALVVVAELSTYLHACMADPRVSMEWELMVEEARLLSGWLVVGADVREVRVGKAVDSVLVLVSAVQNLHSLVVVNSWFSLVRKSEDIPMEPSAVSMRRFQTLKSSLP